MQQWEYATNIMHVSIIEEEKMLEEYGNAGWQLCALYVFDKEFIKYYFKRPIPQPSTVEKIFNEVKNEVDGIPMAAFDEHPPCTCGTDELCRIHSV